MSHTLHTSLTARVWALLTALLVALGVTLAAAAPAQAHDELIGADPAPDSSVDTLPAQLTLTFSAEIADDEGASVVEVTDASGAALVAGAPTVSDNVLTQPLEGAASGAVTVRWKVVSSDGHPISGEFGFTVAGAPSPTPTATATSAPTPTESTAPTASATAIPTVAPDETAGAAPVWPWVVAGLVVLALAGAIAYLVVSRSRREKALADGAGGASGGPTAPGSEPPADH